MKNLHSPFHQHVSYLLTVAILLATVVPAHAQSQPDKEPETIAKSAVVQAEPQSPTRADHLRRINVGDTMPDFSLTTMTGKEILRADYQRRTLIVVYLSAEQRNSERAAADAARVAQKYADHALDLLFITADFGHEEYFQAYFKDASIQAPLAFDGGHELYSKLGLIVFPSTLVVGADGKLDHVILTRRSDYSFLLDAFIGHSLGLVSDETLEQRLVAPSMTRSSPKTLAQRHREAARLLRDNELYRGAEQELLLATELDPQSTPIRLDLADLFLVEERFADAETILTSILKKDADHRGARLLLGISRYQTGQLEEAEEILLAALVMNPNPERTHYYLGRIYEQQGELLKATQHYRIALDRLIVK
jgi:tetratricopeptide (TPR) repeat protein